MLVAATVGALVLALGDPLVRVEGDATCPTPNQVAERLERLLPDRPADMAPDRARLDHRGAGVRVELRRGADATLVGEKPGASVAASGDRFRFEAGVGARRAAGAGSGRRHSPSRTAGQNDVDRQRDIRAGHAGAVAERARVPFPPTLHLPGREQGAGVVRAEADLNHAGQPDDRHRC